MTDYIAINNITDFTKKWGSKNEINADNREQWLAICELFFNAGNYKQKSQLGPHGLHRPFKGRFWLELTYI